MCKGTINPSQLSTIHVEGNPEFTFPNSPQTEWRIHTVPEHIQQQKTALNIPQNCAMTPLARHYVDIEFMEKKTNCRAVNKVFLKPNIQAKTVFRASSIGKLCHCAKERKKEKKKTKLLPSFCYIHRKTLQVHKLLTDRHLASHIHILAVMLTSYCGRNKYLQPPTSISLHTKPCK